MSVMGAIPRLLDKQIIKLVGTWTKGGGSYQWTQLGYTVATLVTSQLPTFEAVTGPPVERQEKSTEEQGNKPVP
jgi:hypothetical protein